MRLLWNRSQLFLASQYILQGTLYGLQTQYLPIILRKTGSSLLSVGYLHLLTFPWLLKSLWAPLVDLYGDSSVWLSLSYAGIAAALLVATAHDGVILAFSLVLLNACSASTDLTLGKVILTDFHADEMSKGSSLQIIGYKVGVLFGGGLTLLLSEHFSIYREIFPALAGIYLLLAVTFCVTHSKTQVQHHHSHKISFPDLTRITGFAHAPGIRWIMTCACFYKFASHSSQSLLIMFLVDRGESIFYIGFITGIAGQLISVTVASVCGIILAAKWMSPVQLFTLTTLLTFCSVLAQLCIVYHGGTTLLFLSLVCALHNVVHGSQATPVYTLMLRCSQGAPPSLQATVFSFLGTLEILGKQLSLFLAGVLAEFLGYTVAMAVSLTGSILIFCLIQICPQYLTKSL